MPSSPTMSSTGEERANDAGAESDKNTVMPTVPPAGDTAVVKTTNGGTSASTPTPAGNEAVKAAPGEPAASTAAVPPMNARIEVLWRLESDGGVEVRWWGARIQDVERNGDSARHILLYDSYGEFGEEVARVEFQADGETLIDVARASDADGGTLNWRLEGAAPLPEVLTVQDVADAVHAGGDGDTIFSAMLEALTSLPADRQVRYASAYRMFADRIKDALVRLLRGKGEDYVVTAADVHAIFAQLRLDAAAGRL